MDNENITLSIIIPVYNSIKFIGKIFSYFEKYNESVELIFIDDCSDDGSYEKILELGAKSNMNTKVIRNKVNSGAGITRNNGIMVSQGKYITFLDADDSFTDDYFENIIPLLGKNYDIIVHDAQFTYDTKEKKYYSMFLSEVGQGLIDKKEALVFVKGCTCGKIYKRELVTDNAIQFLELKRNEDAPFTKLAFSAANSIYYLNKVLYNYYQNSASLMHNKKLLDASNAQKSFLYVMNNIKSDLKEETEAIFLVEYLYSTTLTLSRNMRNKELINYIKQSEKIFPDCYNNKYLGRFCKKHKLVLFLIRHRRVVLLKLITKLKS